MKKFFQIVKPVAFLLFYLVFISCAQAPSLNYNYSFSHDSDVSYVNTPVVKVLAEISFLLGNIENSNKAFFAILNYSVTKKTVNQYEIILPKYINIKYHFGDCNVRYSDLPPPGFV